MQVPKIEQDRRQHGRRRGPRGGHRCSKGRSGAPRISGQKPVVAKARKSIAGFKLREGQSIGGKVTLRGDRMWEFFDRLISLAIPRIRDFRGMPPTSFDGRGNYTFGVTEQFIFPEIDYDKIDAVRGMDITIVTTAPPTKRARHCSMRSASRSSGKSMYRSRKRSSAADQRSEAKAQAASPLRRRSKGRHRSGKEVIDQQSECQAEVQGAWL